MTSEEFDAGNQEIESVISDFNYQDALELLRNDYEMMQLYHASASNYEKLHLYRIIFDGKPDDIDSPVIKKFINEAFHIENDYIYQLNPREYQLVPQYVIDECDRFISALENAAPEG